MMCRSTGHMYCSTCSKVSPSSSESSAVYSAKILTCQPGGESSDQPPADSVDSSTCGVRCLEYEQQLANPSCMLKHNHYNAKYAIIMIINKYDFNIYVCSRVAC